MSHVLTLEISEINVIMKSLAFISISAHNPFFIYFFVSHIPSIKDKMKIQLTHKSIGTNQYLIEMANVTLTRMTQRFPSLPQ